MVGSRRGRFGAVAMALVLWLGGVGPNAVAPKAGHVDGNVATQVRWLAKRQGRDGALIERGDFVSPYFGNQAAMGLLAVDTPQALDVASAWFGWLMSDVGSNGKMAVLYDARYDPATGITTSLGTMDSMDSYAATTFAVAARLYDDEGTQAMRVLVARHIDTVEALAQPLATAFPAGLRLRDGLTVARPGAGAYTMDNAEVYAGWLALSGLEAALGRQGPAAKYRALATETRTAMVRSLWNAGSGTWDVSLGMAADPARFYPDAVAQLWPILFGVVAPTSPMAREPWRAFGTAWPKWPSDHIGDTFPWTVMAVAANTMGDDADAVHLLAAINARFGAAGWAWPWYDGEAGWYLVARAWPAGATSVSRAPSRRGDRR